MTTSKLVRARLIRSLPICALRSALIYKHIEEANRERILKAARFDLPFERYYDTYKFAQRNKVRYMRMSAIYPVSMFANLKTFAV